MKKYNKATAAVVANALMAILGGFLKIGPEMLAAIQTILTAFFVWLVPNQAEERT